MKLFNAATYMQRQRQEKRQRFIDKGVAAFAFLGGGILVAGITLI